METNVMRIFTAAAVAFAAAVLQAETYTWSGGVDTYWLTPGNWSISGSAAESIPGNPDTAVFSGADDTTVVLTNTTEETVYIQSVRVEEGAGAVTIRIPDGWFNARKLQFRRIGGGSERPSVTNIVNNSSYPLTFRYADSSKLAIHFDNYSGDWAAMPGVIYEGPVTMASNAKAWLLPQTDLRTDNDEMNKSVFKNAVTFSAKGLAIGANHEVDIPSTGTMTIPSDDFTVKGTLVVDVGKLVCRRRLAVAGNGRLRLVALKFDIRNRACIASPHNERLYARGVALRDIDRRKISVEERIHADRRDARRNRNRRKHRRVRERRLADCRHATRQHNALQRRVTRERALLDRHHPRTNLHACLVSERGNERRTVLREDQPVN